MSIRQSAAFAIFAAASFVLAAFAAAQEPYPARTVRIVVPFPLGTPPDTLARIASQRLTELWASPVIVESREGASGTIGVGQVVKAAPDGHTLLFTTDFPIVITPALTKAPYDSLKDLAPVGAVAQGVSVLVVQASSGISSISELIAAAKAKPGALSFASAGEASTSRMCMELIKRAAGVDLMHVPYKGAAPAIQAVIGGEVSMYCSPAFQALPHIKSGKLRALAVTSSKPVATMPEVLPLSEQGLPDVSVLSWYAMFTNAGTPPATVGKIANAIKQTFEEPDVRQRLANAGLDPIWLDAKELSARILADLEKWTRLAANLGMRTQ